MTDKFADLTGVRHLRQRLETVATNVCCKFPIDAVATRLIYTCRGVGTKFDNSTDGADPASAHSVAAGMPLILCRASWPNDPQTRFVMGLDPAFDTEDQR